MNKIKENYQINKKIGAGGEAENHEISTIVITNKNLGRDINHHASRNKLTSY